MPRSQTLTATATAIREPQSRHATTQLVTSEGRALQARSLAPAVGAPSSDGDDNRWHIGTVRLHSVHVEACWRPMEGDVAGDFHDVVDLRNGRAALVVGDAPGYGPGAAEIANELRAEARRALRRTDNPVEVLEHLDDRLARRPELTIATAVCAVVDINDRTVRIANAGHPPAVVTDHAGAVMLNGDADPLLGLPASRRVVVRPLSHGGAMHLYTDGLVERRGTPLDESLRELVRLCGDLDGSAAAELARRTTERFGVPADDATVLSVSWAPARAVRSSRPELDTDDTRLREEIASHA